MSNLIRYFVKHSVLVNLAVLVILVFGVIAASNMTSSFFPEQEPEFIEVQAVYPGASPIEMEKGIVLKIEDNLQGISGIERITSFTEENRATVTAEIYADTDENEVLQEVKNAVDRISSFPTGLEQLVVYKDEPTNRAGRLALKGDVPISALKDMADLVEDDLREYDNISRVSIFGFNAPELEVNISETALRNYDLTIQNISDAIAAENLRFTGGIIRGKDMEYRIRVDQRNYYAKHLKDIVVKSKSDGSLVRLRDIATVRDTLGEGAQSGFLNGTSSAFISVNTTNNEDILAASESIKSYIKEFNSRKNNVELVLVDDATQNLRERIDLLQKNGIIGALLVLILLGFFLRIRLAFWVALSIPISFCGMFMLALYYGLTINVISLFGMIIVIGILVDDGIVVAENIYQKYEQGYTPIEAAVKGTVEVASAVTSAVITTVVAFGFFYLIPGQIGEFFSEVAFVVSATLLFSLIEVFIFLPAHLAHSKALHRERGKMDWQEKMSNSIIWVREHLYIPSLKFGLRHKTLLSLLFVIVLILTIASISGGIIRTTFFPEIERNSINIELTLKRGINPVITEKKGREILQAARRLNDRYRKKYDMDKDIFENMEMRVGYESNRAHIVIYLLQAKERQIRSFEIASDLREEVGPMPEAEELSFGTATPFGKPVAISMISPNFTRLREASEQLKSRLSNMPELKDIVDNQNENEPEIRIDLTDKARALGFTTLDVMQQIRNGFFGKESQRLQRGKNEVKVWIRYGLNNRRNLDDLLDMRIHDRQGNKYPLSQLADVKHQYGLVSINHRNGRREIQVSAELADLKTSAPEVIEKIRSDIMPEITAQYPTINYEFEGQVRETRKVAGATQTILPVLLLIIFAIIVWTFKSTLQAVLIFLIIPFGLIGVGWGHFIHGIAVGILSLLGIIALIGIIVNDGLVFITTFNENLKNGKPFYEAIIETGRARFRPVILTTGTTAAGLAPLILDNSFQAQFLIPMAVSVAYGLLITTFLLLVLLPILLVFTNNTKRFFHWLWEGEQVSPEDVEPTIQEMKWAEENE